MRPRDPEDTNFGDNLPRVHWYSSVWTSTRNLKFLD